MSIIENLKSLKISRDLSIFECTSFGQIIFCFRCQIVQLHFLLVHRLSLKAPKTSGYFKVAKQMSSSTGSLQRYFSVNLFLVGQSTEYQALVLNPNGVEYSAPIINPRGGIQVHGGHQGSSLCQPPEIEVQTPLSIVSWYQSSKENVTQLSTGWNNPLLTQRRNRAGSALIVDISPPGQQVFPRTIHLLACLSCPSGRSSSPPHTGQRKQWGWPGATGHQG